MNWSSSPSKVRLFLSLYMTHIRQRGIMLQSNYESIKLAWPTRYKFHNTMWHDPMNPRKGSHHFPWLLSYWQWRRKWSLVHLFLLHMQYQSITTIFCLLKLSTVKIFPNIAVQIKKLTFVGTFGFHKKFQKNRWLEVVKVYNKENVKNTMRRKFLAHFIHPIPSQRTCICKVHKRGNWF